MLCNYLPMQTSNLHSLLGARSMRLIDVANALGVNKATVTRWAQRRVPYDRVGDVSRVTGIPPHELRPDLAEIFTPSTKESAE